MKNYLRLSYLLLVVVFVGACGNDDSETGTDDPVAPKVKPSEDVNLISIDNLEQLYAIRYDLDGDGSADSKSDEKDYQKAFSNLSSGDYGGYKLARDLDFKAKDSYASGEVNEDWTSKGNTEGWEPIGGGDDGSDIEYDEPFTGILDGDGHTILNLYISATDVNDIARGEYVGLFAAIGEEGEVYNLGIEEVEIEALGRIGALAGLLGEDSKVVNCWSTGELKGQLIGGLVGGNEGLIKRCYSEASVEDPRELTAGVILGRTGGLVGTNGGNGNVLNSYATGNVEGVAQVGGLIGWNEGAVVSCYSTSRVKGIVQVGGLIGTNGTFPIEIDRRIEIAIPEINDEAIVAGSYSTGNVSGLSLSVAVGGLVGSNIGVIKACYSTSRVSGENVGGLVSYNASTIEACYVAGQLKGDGSGSIFTEVDDLFQGLDSGSRSQLVSNAEVIASYFDVDVIDTGEGEEGAQETTELQSPVDYEGIYEDWDIDIDGDLEEGGDNSADDPWDFGSETDYPLLKADFNEDGEYTVEEFGEQR